MYYVLLWQRRAASAFFLGCLRQGQSDSAEFTEETAFSRVQRPFYRRKPVVAKNACEGFAPPTIAPTDTFTNFSHLLNLLAAQLLDRQYYVPLTTHCNNSSIPVYAIHTCFFCYRNLSLYQYQPVFYDYVPTYLCGLQGMCLLLLPYMCHISQHSNKGDLKAKLFKLF